MGHRRHSVKSKCARGSCLVNFVFTTFIGVDGKDSNARRRRNSVGNLVDASNVQIGRGDAVFFITNEKEPRLRRKPVIPLGTTCRSEELLRQS